MLPPQGQAYWLPLASGLNTFQYSSMRGNPLFHLLLWGKEVLEMLRILAERMDLTATELLYECPFLLDSAWNPRVYRYLLRLALGRISAPVSSKEYVEPCLATLLQRVITSSEKLNALNGTQKDVEHYTHRLPFDDDLLDLLRFGLEWEKATLAQALHIKHKCEELAKEVI